MIKIGLVNIDTSHPLAFSGYFSQGDRARYVGIYNNGFRGDDEVEAFIAKHGLAKRFSSIDELAQSVDVGFVQSCNWDEHLKQAKPFIERQKPVFIDKPIIGSLSDCKKLQHLVKQGAVILGSSSVRYAPEIAEFMQIPESDRGKTVNIYGTAGVDEFNYAVHIVEAIGGLVGTGALSCRFVGRSEIDSKVCETYFIRFANGVTATYNTFIGTWQPFEVVIMTTKSTFQFRIDTSRIYGALLDRICDFMETGRNSLASVDELVESVKIMLAGRLSREREGIEIKLADIPDDDPGFDGRAFEQDYGSKAAKIYL